MKIALLLSGQLGQFCYGDDKISDNWKNIVTKYGVDVFCITDDNNYYDIESDCQIFSQKNNIKQVTNDNLWRYYKNTKTTSFEESKNKINTILNNCFNNNLKKIQIYEDGELDVDFLISNKNHETFYNYTNDRGNYQKIGLLNQFYKLNKCFNLMKEYEEENNFTYDVIIRCRFDCIIKSLCGDYVDLNTFDFEKKIYSSKCEFHMNDWWCVGNRYIMEIYCNYYLNMSQNLIDNYKLFIYHDKGTVIDYEKGYNITKNNKKSCWDVSDSSEIGLTYLINELEKYEIINNLDYCLKRKYD